MDSIRELHNLPGEAGRGFPEMNDAAFVQALLTAGGAGTAGDFDPSK